VNIARAQEDERTFRIRRPGRIRGWGKKKGAACEDGAVDPWKITLNQALI
jgi:hypothetical protein